MAPPKGLNDTKSWVTASIFLEVRTFTAIKNVTTLKGKYALE
jgi:hypothetical protein